MMDTPLLQVTQQVIERARTQGYVLAREVRAELTRAGLAKSLWKDVLAQARSSLSYRRGRYYYTASSGERLRAEQSQQADIRSAVQQLIEQHRQENQFIERREQPRVDFIQPVRVTTEDGKSYTLLTRDLSTSGIRLIGTRRLLGQKIRIQLLTGKPPVVFTVRILWTCLIGEDLFENGGTFLTVETA